MTDDRGAKAEPAVTGRLFLLAIATVLLAMVSFALFVAVDAAQATGRDLAERSLRRAVASLTEVDSLAPAALPELAADAASGEEPLLVRDFPIPVEMTSREARKLTPEGLRELLVARSAEAIYDRGMSVFLTEGGIADGGFFSLPGTVERGVGSLGEATHESLRWAVWVLLAIWVGVAAVVVVGARGYARLTLVGSAVAAAAVPILVLAVGARFGLGVAADVTDDYISGELMRLARDVSWVAIRNGIAFAGLGLGLLLLGLAGSWLEEAPRRSRPLTG